jgi:hypothetical protein
MNVPDTQFVHVLDTTLDAQFNAVREKWEIKLPRGLRFTLHTFCWSVALVHCGIFLFFSTELLKKKDESTLPYHFIIPLTKNMGAWMNKSYAPPPQDHIGDIINDQCTLYTSHESRSPNFYIQQLPLLSSKYDARVAILVFHLLSFLFQFGNCWYEEFYMDTLREGKTHLGHFLEYSVSASLMITTIGVQLGVNEIYTLLGVFFNGWACMVFGFLAEIFFEKGVSKVSLLTVDVYPHTLAHIAGWVTLAAAVASVCSNLYTFQTCVKNTHIPSFVFPLVGVEIAIFSVFGLVQAIGLWKKPKFDGTSNKLGDSNYTKRVNWAFATEFWYILLSLCAKSILGFTIFFGT